MELSAEPTKPRIIPVSDRTRPDELQPKLWIHPLDRPEVELQLRQHFKEESLKRLKNSPRPGLSASPDAEEQQYAQSARERLEKTTIGDYIEPTDSYVLRVLYEETFAVTPVAKIGGILSHHYREGLTVNGKQMSEVALM